MMEKKIVININETGEITAETFGFSGTSCVDEIDKLMKDIARMTDRTHKPEYFKENTVSDTTIKVGHND